MFVVRAVDEQHWMVGERSDLAESISAGNSILKSELIEELIGEKGDVGMHSILGIKHREVLLLLLRKLVEEGLLEQLIIADHCWVELLLITH